MDKQELQKRAGIITESDLSINENAGKPEFKSEMFNDMAKQVIGIFYTRCKYEADQNHQGSDIYKLHDECEAWWYAMDALDRLSISVNSSKGGATHFSMALRNEKQKVAEAIKSFIGVDVYADKVYNNY